MAPEQIKKGGWIKHDGKGMPDCYGDNDFDVVLEKGGIYRTRFGDEYFYQRKRAGRDIAYHRRHYSTNELLVMAKRNLARTAAHLQAAISLLEASDKSMAPSDKMFDEMMSDYKASTNRSGKTLTLINERLGDE